MQTEITLYRGQPVHWPAAPNNIAQVDELLLRNVRLVYRTKSGRTCRPLVRPRDLAARAGAVLPFPNLLNRAIVKHAKRTYSLGNSGGGV